MYEYNCYVETPNRIGMEPSGCKAERDDVIVEQVEPDADEFSLSLSPDAKKAEEECNLQSKPYMELEIKLEGCEGTEVVQGYFQPDGNQFVIERGGASHSESGNEEFDMSAKNYQPEEHERKTGANAKGVFVSKRTLMKGMRKKIRRKPDKEEGAAKHEKDRKKKTQKKHYCKECERAFTQKSSLIIHQRVHTGERPFKCDHCDARFKQQIDLTRHRDGHLGRKPFLCPTCQKTFARPGDLSRHILIHSGEKRFVCDACGKRFSRRVRLTAHLNTVHLDGSSKMAQMKHSCSTCHKLFYDPSNLKAHERIHSGERPYKCLQCGATFIQSSYLNIHVRTHSGEKPYKCQLCDKSFIANYALTQHIKKAHKSSS